MPHAERGRVALSSNDATENTRKLDAHGEFLQYFSVFSGAQRFSGSHVIQPADLRSHFGSPLTWVIEIPRLAAVSNSV